MTFAINFADVQAAAAQLAGVAHRTPVVTSRTFNQRVGAEVFFKCENLQRVGAFKFRGAYNALSRLSAVQKKAGVVTHSSGNHAQGVALAARLLGIAATIVMPTDAPQAKLAATRGYGAEIVLYDRQTRSREELSAGLARERNLALIHPYDNPHIMAGQGTAALELLQQVPDLDVLVAPVGGGGLLSGCTIAAKAMRPAIRIFGVETHTSNDWWLSLRAGQRIKIAPPETIADGIRTQQPGELTFPIVQHYAEDILLVSDAQVVETLNFILTRMKLVVEPTGAVAPAAVYCGLTPAVGAKIGVILSGGNIDASLLAGLLAQS